MAMSDCEKCWESPCVCGWEYRGYSPEQRAKLVAAVTSSGPVAASTLLKPQPIATARRDGTEIIGIWQYAGVEFAALMRWVQEWPMPEPDDRPGWWGYYHSVTQVEFADDNADRPWLRAPTHWLPYESPFE